MWSCIAGWSPLRLTHRMVLLYYFANMWNVFSDFHSLLYAIPGCICSGCKLLYFIGTYEYSSLEKGQSKGCLGLALFASVLEETGNEIGVKSSSLQERKEVKESNSCESDQRGCVGHDRR